MASVVDKITACYSVANYNFSLTLLHCSN